MSMDPVWDNPDQSEVVNRLADRTDPSVHDHHYSVAHQRTISINVPPPSPQEPSKLDTVFARSLSAPLRSNTILVNEHRNPIAMDKHADMLDRLLRQATTSHRNGRHRQSGGGGPDRPPKRDLKKTSVETLLKRRTRAATHRVEKPSRIPITAARLRARAAANKATSDLADAIATFNLS